jgi:hypothetical protein
MLSKLAFVSLFFALSVQSQTKPTGGKAIAEEEIDTAIESQHVAAELNILKTVRQNMGMCSTAEKPIESMKDLYSYLSEIQNKKAVEAVVGATEIVQTDNAQCAKPKFAFISTEVSCLLSGVEEQMHSFASNSSSAKYLEKSLNVNKTEAASMLKFMNYVNGPGYVQKQESKKKKKKMEDIEKEKGDI